MPDIKELMAIAAEKQKKKFSRGNRPDLLVDTGRSANAISEKLYSNGINEVT